MLDNFMKDDQAVFFSTPDACPGKKRIIYIAGKSLGLKDVRQGGRIGWPGSKVKRWVGWIGERQYRVGAESLQILSIS
jgi:hypothetical protein